MSRITELVWRSNNHSVIRSLNEIAKQGEKTSGQLKRSNREAASSFTEVGRSAERTRLMVGGLAGMVGLGGLGLGLRDVIHAGTEWQAQQAQLQIALKNTGNAGKATQKRLLDAAESISTRGGFGASQTLQGITQFVRVSGNAADATNKVALATNISRSSGRDFTQVLRALLMAEQGRTTGLARLGVAIPKVTAAEDALKRARFDNRTTLEQLVASGVKLSSAQKAQYALSHQVTPEMLAQAKAQDALASKQRIFALLQQRYGGSTAAFSRTTAGQISNARNQIDILNKTMSQRLLPIVGRVASGLAHVIMWLMRHKQVAIALGIAVGSVTAILTAHAAVMEVVKARTIVLSAAQRLLGLSAGEAAVGEEGATAATLGWGAAMNALPILALITGLVLIVTHFKRVKQIAGDAWKWIKTAAADTWGWIKSHWPLLAGILLSPIIGPVGIIVALFHKQIIGGIRAAIRWITGAWHTLTGILTWPFRELIKIAEKAWGIIKKIAGLPGKLLGGLGHLAGGALHTLSFGLLHTGGVVRPKYLAMGGPVGSDTVPGWLTPGEGVLNTAAMRILGERGLNQLNRGQHPDGNWTIHPGVTVVKVDGRAIAQAMTQYVLRRGARGPSSLVGGSLATGSAVTFVTPG